MAKTTEVTVPKTYNIEMSAEELDLIRVALKVVKDVGLSHFPEQFGLRGRVSQNDAKAASQLLSDTYMPG